MATCSVCGQDIDIRWVGGKLVPIHPGGWCPGAASRSTPSAGLFRTIDSYVNPNATCPVCGKTVFFYQSPHGGRVFFDALGWPWPKHPCTDTTAAQTGKVPTPRRGVGGATTLRDNSGAQLEIYEIDETLRTKAGRDIKFRRIRDRSIFRVHLSDAKIKDAKLEWDDFHDAPSFVVAPSIKDHPTRKVQFICERLRRVVTIELPKV